MNLIAIQAVGHALPTGRVKSETLERELELPAGWMERRTGIRTRRVVEGDQAVSDLATAAAQAAINHWRAASKGSTSGVAREAPRAVVLATSTPDHLLPPTAPRVAHELGLNGVPAFDMAVACSGFVYGLQVASGLVQQLGGPVLLIAANVLSKRVDPQDVRTRALFADAAGAVVLAAAAEPANSTSRGILACHLESAGDAWSCLQIPAGGSREPFSAGTVEQGRQFMLIEDSQRAYRYAVESMARCGSLALKSAKVPLSAVRWWIPHQANERVIREVQRRLGCSDEQTVSVIRDLGNSSAATIPVACSLWVEQGHLQRGDLVLVTAAGAGLAAGAALVRW